jgi:hypothetical protein
MIAARNELEYKALVLLESIGHQQVDGEAIDGCICACVLHTSAPSSRESKTFESLWLDAL